MYSTAAPRERAFLVGAELTGGRSPWKAEDSLQELTLLADTAGLEVVGSAYQRLKQPFSKHFIGPGKVEEIAALREELKYDLVIFDDELTPGQTRNLEDALKVQVLDRTGLILDIFATHARTHEGRIQVELAQYKYLLPRLRRQWLHLERQAGGGGASAGGVVGLRCVRQDGEVLIEVCDDGPGIPQPVREQVFERFYRHAGSQANGSGLGLSIAREIVRSHGGRITIEDGEPNPGGGRGTCVRVHLPLTPPARRPQPRA